MAAKNTDIPDPPAAERGLQMMAARADALREKLQSIRDRINHLEAQQPWGPTPEFGKPFQQIYHAGNDAGKGGSEFIKANVTILADEIHQGTRLGHAALAGQVELDQEIADMFRVKAGDQEYGGVSSDDVSGGIKHTFSAIDETYQAQNDQAQHDQ
jgi:hypothetical protein